MIQGSGTPDLNRRHASQTPGPKRSLHALNLPIALSESEHEQLKPMVSSSKRLKRGEHLYRIGDPFHALYTIRAGSLMTSFVSETGREQVTGFQMTGEIMGLDAIITEEHLFNAMALEDTQLAEIPFEKLLEAAAELPPLQQQLLKIMSRKIVNDQGIMMLLGSKTAEERLAHFLLNLSQTYAARGYSPRQFQLRMRREDIGSYLGLKLETISRTLSRFQDEGLIRVQTREIELLDLSKLEGLALGSGTRTIN